jgi:uncharacterized peroxidase-related enzyme
VVLYRPRFFGRSWIRFTRDVMRGPSEWSTGERELLAAFISRRNECPYCVGIHTHTATLGLARLVDIEMLDRWREKQIDPRMRAAFELLEKRASDPAALRSEDFTGLRAAGVSEAGILDVLHVAFVFDLINRLANVFGFSSNDDAGRRSTAAMLHRLGYRVPGLLLG